MLTYAGSHGIQLFVWDDGKNPCAYPLAARASNSSSETDSLEFSPLINDFEKSCTFRRETMAYIEATLQKERTVDLDSISTNRVITNFKPVGEAIAKHCNQREHTRAHWKP